MMAIIAIALVSCSKEKDPKTIARENFEAKLLNSLNDASSYEFVEMTDLHPLKGEYMFKIKNAELNLKKIGMQDTIEISKERAELIKYKNDSEGVYGYTNHVKIRANNKLGAKVLNEYRVTYDKDYNVEEIE